MDAFRVCRRFSQPRAESRAESRAVSRIAPRAAALLLLVALAPALAGCALFERRWPPEGGGGYGELQEIADERARLLEGRLLEFDARGARRFAGAEYDEAAQLFVRVRRELAADHPEDAALDMDRLEELNARIERRLRGARR